jgi:hypothetical protein
MKVHVSVLCPGDVVTIIRHVLTRAGAPEITEVPLEGGRVRLDLTCASKRQVQQLLAVARGALLTLETLRRYGPKEG